MDRKQTQYLSFNKAKTQVKWFKTTTKLKLNHQDIILYKKASKKIQVTENQMGANNSNVLQMNIYKTSHTIDIAINSSWRRDLLMKTLPMMNFLNGLLDLEASMVGKNS